MRTSNLTASFVAAFSWLAGTRHRTHRGPNGLRAYAVGDVHGRQDLLESMLEAIDKDAKARDPRPTFLIFLGDLVDRGPDSAGVIERLRGFERAGTRSIFLTGNHEELFLRVLDGERGILDEWLRYGGAECIISYGVDLGALCELSEERQLGMIRTAVPASHVEFLRGFGDTFRFGDYLFVHAGIRPGIPLEDQETADLRWIRDPFLNDAQDHGFLVVHGHTISREIEERANRICIDTGAYRSGTLTALGIEDGHRWYIGSAGKGACKALVTIDSKRETPPAADAA